MKNIPLHIEEHELDQLLRQFVMDNNPDEFTQNTLTMNADIIFNRNEEITPLSKRENELILKLEKAFIRRRGFGKFWLNGIILFVISVSILIYKMNCFIPKHLIVFIDKEFYNLTTMFSKF